MPYLAGPSVKIIQNLRQCREFPVPNSYDEYYVEISSGTFEISIAIPIWMPLLGHFFVADIEIDGYRLDPYILEVQPGRATTINCYDTHDRVYLFTFHPLAGNKGLPNGALMAALQSQGTIVIRLGHGRYGPRRAPLAPLNLPLPQFPQVGLQNIPLSHGFVLGPAMPIQPRDVFLSVERVDYGRTICPFVYRYCNRATLQSLGVVPNDDKGNDGHGENGDGNNDNAKGNDGNVHNGQDGNQSNENRDDEDMADDSGV